MSGKSLVIFVVAAFIGAIQAVPVELVTKMLEYRDTCIAVSGSEEGYQQIIDSIQPAKNCILNQLDVQQMKIDAEEFVNGSRKPFIDKYCPKFNESISCFDDTFEGIAKCIGDDVDQTKAIVKSMVYNLLDLACQNDGEYFFEAQKPEFRACVNQLKDHGALECKVSDETKKTPISKYGEQQCRELDGALDCIKRKVNECNVPKLVDVFQAMFQPIYKANDCKQYNTLDGIHSNSIDGTVSEN